MQEEDDDIWPYRIFAMPSAISFSVSKPKLNLKEGFILTEGTLLFSNLSRTLITTSPDGMYMKETILISSKISDNSTQFPQGSYCLYKLTNQTCPTNFTEGHIYVGQNFMASTETKEKFETGTFENGPVILMCLT